MNTRNLLLTTLLIVALALGAGMIMAQDEGGNGDEDGSAKQQRDYGRRGGFRPGRGFHGFGGRGLAMPGGPAPVLMDLVTEATGLEPAALHAALRGGDTLAALIEANGGDAEAFIAEATATVTESATARITERIESMVRGDYGVGKFGIDRAEMAAGLQEAMEAWLDEAVESGRISEERAATYREAMAERLEAMESGDFARGLRGRGGRGWHGWPDDDRHGDKAMDDDESAETTDT